MSKSQMEAPKRQSENKFQEYILVTDRDSLVIKSGTYQECVTQANFARKCGGEVTIFKATKG